MTVLSLSRTSSVILVITRTFNSWTLKSWFNQRTTSTVAKSPTRTSLHGSETRSTCLRGFTSVTIVQGIPNTKLTWKGFKSKISIRTKFGRSWQPSTSRNRWSAKSGHSGSQSAKRFQTWTKTSHAVATSLTMNWNSTSTTGASKWMKNNSKTCITCSMPTEMEKFLIMIFTKV